MIFMVHIDLYIYCWVLFIWLINGMEVLSHRERVHTRPFATAQNDDNNNNHIHEKSRAIDERGIIPLFYIF